MSRCTQFDARVCQQRSGACLCCLLPVRAVLLQDEFQDCKTALQEKNKIYEYADALNVFCMQAVTEATNNSQGEAWQAFRYAVNHPCLPECLQSMCLLQRFWPATHVTLSCKNVKPICKICL